MFSNVSYKLDIIFCHQNNLLRLKFKEISFNWINTRLFSHFCELSEIHVNRMKTVFLFFFVFLHYFYDHLRDITANCLRDSSSSKLKKSSYESIPLVALIGTNVSWKWLKVLSPINGLLSRVPVYDSKIVLWLINCTQQHLMFLKLKTKWIIHWLLLFFYFR